MQTTHDKDLEAALSINEALANLSDNYPQELRDKAHEAFGRLILGHLNLKQPTLYIIPTAENGYTKLENGYTKLHE